MQLIVGRRARIALTVVSSCVLACTAFTAAAGARTVGTIPPANPKADCTAAGAWTVKGIDRCRALEGVGPLTLPSNWAKLTNPQKLLVMIDLERVNRGLRPVVGLSPVLDELAQAGADQNTDPGFPASGFSYAGSLWGATDSVIEVDYGWMYEDGYVADVKQRVNQQCTAPNGPECWGHRDVMLMTKSGKIVGGGGYSPGSFAFEMLVGYPTAELSFTWASELKHFAVKPGIEPLKKPNVASVSPAGGSVAGGTRVTIRGMGLQSLTSVSFGSGRGDGLNCTSNRRCTVKTPPHTAGPVKVTARNEAGKSAAAKAVTFTYAEP